ncbi:MAG: ArsR/SmtB family transcription factor, partial [Actinomycetes bacterium]
MHAPQVERHADASRPADLGKTGLVDVFKALADPVRLRIVQVLLPGEPVARNVTDWECDLSRATMSHHFRTLRDTGLIDSWASGRTQCVQLNTAAI